MDTPADNLAELGTSHGGERSKRGAARLPIFSNALLTLLKLLVVGVTGSVSVLAEAVNSAADLFGSAIAYATVRAADIPPDESHEYGHGKFENLSGIVISMLIVFGGAYALSEALQHLIMQSHVLQSGPAIGVMAFSVVLNTVVSRRLLSVGRRYDSPALVADGKHLQTDIISSAAALLGLTATYFTHLYWIDPVVAIGITALIFWVASQIGRDAVLMLSDAALPIAEEELLRRAFADDPRVLGYHKLRTRKSGSHRHIDVHVQIDDRHTFVEAHRLTEELEDKLRGTLPNLHPIIHIEPFEAENRHQKEEQGAE